MSSPDQPRTLIKPSQRKAIILIGLIIMSGVSLSIPVAGQADTPDTHIFIQSRFILWDIVEKMIDNNFTVTIINLNNSNITNYYNVLLNDQPTTGSFNQSVTIPFDLDPAITMIKSLVISVNNITYFEAYDIIIVRGMTQDIINQSPGFLNLISMSPLEWTQAEWNIFFAVVSGGVFAVWVAYRLVKKYRIAKGVKVIK